MDHADVLGLLRSARNCKKLVVQDIPGVAEKTAQRLRMKWFDPEGLTFTVERPRRHQKIVWLTTLPLTVPPNFAPICCDGELKSRNSFDVGRKYVIPYARNEKLL